jgi:hypothetical protein
MMAKLIGHQLSVHHIIDDGERLIAFEHPVGLYLQIGDGCPPPLSVSGGLISSPNPNSRQPLRTDRRVDRCAGDAGVAQNRARKSPLCEGASSWVKIW